MAFTDDVFPPDDLCEICGARLDDEIVIQEFADGSLARLCGECAAGATLSTEQHLGHDLIQPLSDSPAPADADPMERTRELLTPVVDLIGLQREMQGALERLAASLETFAAGVLTENLDKTATVEDRVQSLERELEQTRARLREAEALLSAASITLSDGAAPAKGTGIAADEEALGDTVVEFSSTEDGFEHVQPIPIVEVGAAAAAGVGEEEGTITGAGAADEGGPADEAAPADEDGLVDEAAPAAELLLEAETDQSAEQTQAEVVSWPEPIEEPLSLVSESEAPTPQSSPDAAPPPWPGAADSAEEGASAQSPLPPRLEGTGHVFRIEEVQAAQRYFNESPFTGKTRDVQSSLGKPRANLTRAAGPEPRAFVTVAWDIVWYQYLVDMRVGTPSDQRVVLHREGMDLNELAHQFREKNAIIDDSGRLDASELEIKLLSDPTTLITEMTQEEERALEDATEEIWDQRIAPEFKWDD